MRAIESTHGGNMVLANRFSALFRASLFAVVGALTANANAQTPVPRYRIYIPSTQAHLFTTDKNENDYLVANFPTVYIAEGIDHQIYKTAATVGGVAAVPYYRVYIKPLRQHFWTSDSNEYNVLNALSTTYGGEGIDGYVFLRAGVPGTVPLYRLVLKGTGVHTWTVDQNEFNVLTATGSWLAEGAIGNPSGVEAYVFPPPARLSAQQASRFLAQATFGPRMTDIDALTGSNYDTWITTQFAKQQSLHLPGVSALVLALPVDQQMGQNEFQRSMWKQFSQGDDQLRQRVAFALSQLFVISLDSSLSAAYPRGPANYLDLLGKNAFGNYRDLLDAVTYSPMMGIYLSSLKNVKENLTTGAVPDENYAREVMQLFSIGLYQLNLDGSIKRDANGKELETYTNADITGLAKVFTGLSWGGPDKSNARFLGNQSARDLNREILPMQGYNQYHATNEKRFLGVTIPANTTSDTDSDVTLALDTLFNHPNVGPFIGKQLIQRLVSSNPSPAYVARVAAVFNDNGAGVRGDMKSIIKAILLDVEARNTANATDQSGKLREPVIRLLQWMRAFNAKSTDGKFLIGDLSDPSTELAQSPLRSPSVFNFYRPNYVPPNSLTAAAALVSPEAQITSETSVAGYLNYMRTVVSNGVGTNTNGARDVQADYSAELALATNPDALVDRINLLLTAGKLSATTRTTIRDAVAAVTIRSTAPQSDTDKRNRVYLAIYLTLASPDYILQN
jgi:uncharacterized protein (DUF1800 family)